MIEQLDFKKFKTNSLTLDAIHLSQQKITWERLAPLNRNYFHSSFPVIQKTNELNIFKQVRPSETTHSSIICELLNPNGKHGAGSTFLHLFFECLGVCFCKNQKWVVTAEKERYDIRICNTDNSHIVIIENKSNWAGDQPNQLYRYWYYGIYIPQFNLECTSQNKTTQQIFYLSPNDYKAPSTQSMKRPDNFDDSLPEKVPIQVEIIFFNKEIIIWLEKCLSEVDKNTDMYYYIKQYLSFWRN